MDQDHQVQAESLGQEGTIQVVAGTACYRNPQAREVGDLHGPIDQEGLDQEGRKSCWGGMGAVRREDQEER